jgi:general stress protein 26
MSKTKEKVTAKWNKKEKDWFFRYPEYQNRNGKITAHFFDGMIKYADDYAKELGYEDLRDYFEKGGFDPDTFEIKIHAKLGQKYNIRSDGEPNC